MRCRRSVHGAVLVTGALALLLTAGCGAPGSRPEPPKATQAAAAPKAPPTPPQTQPTTSTAAMAVAVLAPTAGNAVSGKVTFTAVPEGVRVEAEIDGLTPGPHGFHLHEWGDCSAPDGTSAGGHFNPGGVQHGAPDVDPAHAGDLGNLVANESGHAHLVHVSHRLTIGEGPGNVLGRSVIVHADADDFVTQPTGNAGARVACGVVTNAEGTAPPVLAPAG